MVIFLNSFPGHLAFLPKEAPEQHENPVCPESYPYMAGEKNQVRQLWACPYDYHKPGKQTVPLYRVREDLYRRTGSPCLRGRYKYFKWIVPVL